MRLCDVNRIQLPQSLLLKVTSFNPLSSACFFVCWLLGARQPELEFGSGSVFDSVSVSGIPHSEWL
jgi:hypothetical protein